MINKLNGQLIWIQNFIITWINGIILALGSKNTISIATYFTLPKFNKEQKDKKICVIGGGANGLLVAWELNQLGFQTKILEKSNRVGGRTKTQKIDGSQIEKSTMWLHSGYNRIRLILNAYGLHTFTDVRASIFSNYEEASLFKESKKFARLGSLSILFGIIKFFYHSFRFLTYKFFLFMGWPVETLSIRKELSMNYNEWLDSKGLNVLKPFVLIGVVAQGYGFPEETPVFYLFQWLRPFVVIGALNPFRQDTQEILEGWGTLWNRMASDQDIKYNVDVKEVNNCEDKVDVTYYDGDSKTTKTENYDYVVMAHLLKDSVNLVKNKAPKIDQLANQLNRNKYMTALVEYEDPKIPITGRGYFIDRWYKSQEMGFGKICIFKNHVKPSNSPNQKRNLMLLGSICRKNARLEDFKNEIDNCNWLKIKKIIEINEFDYFPWFNSENCKNGAIESLYKNRKFQRVYFTGPEFSFESINFLSEYAYITAKEIEDELCNVKSWSLTRFFRRIILLVSYSRL